MGFVHGVKPEKIEFNHIYLCNELAFLQRPLPEVLHR
jgi:hypothetical protein